ncbi:nicotinate-nucleotide pyrophosphorylase (carboxylating) [Pseudopedobacter saltans DSM 12145]|uniref:Probable nicotinate-nucleotide pyrophosphorylase [carboxylating] n=1 Tax=Pseudopedobacter saltans (strain ATCC 51119 / DSM 12145 / JCM 21818 / CCUG 39354 / LMG 10337 / NBRC 100064 / NCIMB 13643) TaxID=762903 RepID=F0SAG6_PSESL|nr:nicotinate-nucleotide pyrophosphorylase (carboxylating) [Pseudopedobacter saltans DSM 12145]
MKKFIFLPQKSQVLDKNIVRQIIKSALAEDLGDGDHTSLSTIPKDAKGKARLLVKEDGVIAGVDVAVEVCNEVDPDLNVEILLKDGTEVKVGDVVLYVSGSVQSILVAERLLLNLMQRMSGIATTTHKIVKNLKGTGTKVLDTRKTTPNLRYLEKMAVKIGGGVNHRFGLYDMILIKDNHVDYAGGIENAVKAAQDYLKKENRNLQIEVEVRNLEELRSVLAIGGIDRVLLDNFNFEDLKKAVAIVDKTVATEASGNITPQNALDYAKCGVDYISMGALTHSVKGLDLSLKAVVG